MILVDIYIPSLEKTYDFQVNEEVSVEELTLEISEMIANETKSGKGIRAGEFMLCSMDRERILKKNSTLKEAEIKNGSRLLLV